MEKNCLRSKELIKKNFNITRDSIPHEEPKKHLINSLEKSLLNLRI